MHKTSVLVFFFFNCACVSRLVLQKESVVKMVFYFRVKKICVLFPEISDTTAFYLQITAMFTGRNLSEIQMF